MYLAVWFSCRNPNSPFLTSMNNYCIFSLYWKQEAILFIFHSRPIFVIHQPVHNLLAPGQTQLDLAYIIVWSVLWYYLLSHSDNPESRYGSCISIIMPLTRTNKFMLTEGFAYPFRCIALPSPRDRLDGLRWVESKVHHVPVRISLYTITPLMFAGLIWNLVCSLPVLRRRTF